MVRWLPALFVLWGCGRVDPAPDGVESVPMPPTGDTAAVPDLMVTVEPSEARAGLDSLTCRAPEGSTVVWSRDGAAVAHATSVVEAAEVTPGAWRCDATLEGVSGAGEAVAAAVGGNLLVILIDDVGLDKIGAYGVHPQPPSTPRLDQLAQQGVRFDHAYAMPMCSPTRAALLTGRLPGRTGVGHLVESDTPTDWLAGEDTLPDVLGRSPTFDYASVATGKWHLANIRDVEHPMRAGFDGFSGSMNNPHLAVYGDGQPRGYYHWEKNTGGSLAFTDTYMTVDTVDDAVAQLQTLPEPWLLYVPFNAAHEPWHAPPVELHAVALDSSSSVADKMDAMVEALDTEIGRLLDAMTPAQHADTTIVVVGDNGTQEPVIRSPLPADRGKGTLYEGGVRVPLIVVSPHVSSPGSTSDAMVHVVDVLPTAAALAGVSLDDGIVRDGRSLLPLLSEPEAPWPREFLYSQKFRPNGFSPYTRWSTVRDERWKLTWDDRSGVDVYGLYDLSGGGLDEGPDLLAAGPLAADAQAAHDRLLVELDRIEAQWSFP